MFSTLPGVVRKTLTCPWTSWATPVGHDEHLWAHGGGGQLIESQALDLNHIGCDN